MWGVWKTGAIIKGFSVFLKQQPAWLGLCGHHVVTQGKVKLNFYFYFACTFCANDLWMCTHSFSQGHFLNNFLFIYRIKSFKKWSFYYAVPDSQYSNYPCNGISSLCMKGNFFREENNSCVTSKTTNDKIEKPIHQLVENYDIEKMWKIYIWIWMAV